MLTTIDVNIVNALAVLGILFAIPHLYRICDLFWLYFLRPSSVGRYLHGKTLDAIVTGATDGIGKVTATELLTRRFSPILHGRNETKMQKEKVVHELRALAAGSAPDIRYSIADAKGTHDWERLLEPFRDLHATVVVHNVTGGEGAEARLPFARHPHPAPKLAHIDASRTRVDGHTEGYLLGAARGSAFFALLLTRALLPQTPPRRGGPCRSSSSAPSGASPPRCFCLATPHPKRSSRCSHAVWTTTSSYS